MSYLDNGFDEFFQRVDPDSQQQEQSDQLAQMYAYGMPANSIVGGTMTSQNGNLTIDLTQGLLNYNDGSVDLLTVGGQNNNVSITSANNNSLVNTSS